MDEDVRGGGDEVCEGEEVFGESLEKERWCTACPHLEAWNQMTLVLSLSVFHIMNLWFQRSWISKSTPCFQP